YDSLLRALDPERGTVEWTLHTAGPIRSSPAIGADGTVYFAADDSKLYAADGRTGREQWELPLEGYATRFLLYYSQICASPIVGADHVVYIGTDTGYLYSVDGVSGAVKWRTGPGPGISGAPALAQDGTLYTGLMSGTLRALRASDGVTLWEVDCG